MSAPDPWHSPPGSRRGCPLLVVIDPAARSTDGESVRIAKDVLCAAAPAKICFPDSPEEFARALARRGSRCPVIVGDDRALIRAVELLHRERELANVALSMVPVGSAPAVALARALGVPTDAVAAARTVLDGIERRLDLLMDDSGGVVLGGLRIPSGISHDDPEEPSARPAGPGWSNRHEPVGGGPTGEPGEGVERPRQKSGEQEDGRGGSGKGGGGRARSPLPAARSRPWWTPAARTARSALSLLTLPVPGLGGGPSRRHAQLPAQRLRIEADGVLLADLDRPVEHVSVSTASAARADTDPASADAGLADVVVRPRSEGSLPIYARARAITVSGPDFRYRADAVVGGPVRTRTWTVRAGGWRLMLPP